MGNEVDRVIASHIHFLQEEGRVRFAFGKDRDQDIGARHFLPARALDMDRGALDHPLEGGGGNGLGSLHVGDEGRQVIFDEIDQQLAQFVQIDIAGAHHLDRVRFLGQGQKKMFERGKLVSMFVRQRKRLVNGLFQGGRETWHGRLLSVDWRYGHILRPTCPDCHDTVKIWWISVSIKSFLVPMPRFSHG